jgi:heme/copper-type cytochrome/quinol oxidase subunit 3
VASADPRRDSPRALRGVRAARVRARATRGAIFQILLASIFLAGALAHARAPDRASNESRLWMTGLLVLSMVDVALGTRTLARVRRAPARLWILGAAAWGVLSTLVVGFLLRG